MAVFMVANTKGGVGKSTLSVQVSIGLHLRGFKVWHIDGDVQHSSLDSMTARSETGRSAIAAAGYPDGRTLRAQLQKQKGEFDHIVIESGGYDSSALRAGLLLCDIALIPFKPRSYDVWALNEVNELLQKEILPARGDFPLVALLNEADPAGTDNADSVAAVAEYPDFQLLDLGLSNGRMGIGRRKAIPHASASGLHISEYKPKDEAAIEEIDALIDKLLAYEVA